MPAEAPDRLGAPGELDERGVGEEAFRRAARREVEPASPGRVDAVVGLDLAERDLGNEEIAQAAVDADLEVLATEAEREALPPGPQVARERAAQKPGLAARGVGVLVGVAGGEADDVGARIGRRHAVVGLEAALDLGEHDVGAGLMAAAVDPAPLEAAAPAHAGVGAVAEAAAEDPRLGRHHAHVDRHLAVDRVLALRLDLDAPEVRARAEIHLELQQLVLVERLARLPRDVAAHDVGVDHGLLEPGLAEEVARPGVVDDHDVGGVVDQVDADLGGLVGGVEVALGRGRRFERGLALLVERVHDDVAGVEREARPRPPRLPECSRPSPSTSTRWSRTRSGGPGSTR